MVAKPKNATLVIVAEDMKYSKNEETRRRGRILARITDELGDYLKYVFMMRKPCYLDQDNILVRLLIDEYNDGDKNSLTMQLVSWLKENVPHQNFTELQDVHVWTECMPNKDEWNLYTVLSSKDYSIAIGKINGLSFGEKRPQFRLYVWKN